MDRRLTPRVADYLSSKGIKASIAKPLEVTKALRLTYPEYSRQPERVLMKMVSVSLSRLSKAEIENDMTRKAMYGEEEETCVDEEEGEEESDEGVEEAIAQAEMEIDEGMNASLRSMYAGRNTEDGGVGTTDATVRARQQENNRHHNNNKKTGKSQKKRQRMSAEDKGRGDETAKATHRGGGAGDKKFGPSFPTVTYSSLGGIEGQLKIIEELIERPLRHPQLYEWLGVEPPRGVLLHGPPGCGKTQLAQAIANECGVPFFSIAAPEIVSGMSGESEAKIRKLFNNAASQAPAIIFIDEIDSIAPRRDSSNRQMESRIVAQLLTCMDGLAFTKNDDRVPEAEGGSAPHERSRLGHVVVLGATNRPEVIDPALRRAGRFDREVGLGIPDEAGRERILEVLTRGMRLEGEMKLEVVAKRTPGFVGADLAAVCKEAAAVAVARAFRILGPRLKERTEVEGVEGVGTRLSAEDLSGIAIVQADFDQAVGRVQPSAQREGFATIPGVTWEDVGSLLEVRDEIDFAITRPIKNPKVYESLGLISNGGVLMYGPPGCGKTLVAKATANASSANFISIKGPELLNKYVGESERAVRTIFSRAQAAAPCVLFFDEIDALAPKRGSDVNAAADRLVNQLLAEMDGLEPRVGVYVVAATNRPDMIDPALLRPGRLEKLLFVPLPPPSGRASILTALLRKTPLADGALQTATELVSSDGGEGMSGADIAALVREACVASLRENMKGSDIESDPNLQCFVTAEHFRIAMARVPRSVSRTDRNRYDTLRRQFEGVVLKKKGTESKEGDDSEMLQ